MQFQTLYRWAFAATLTICASAVLNIIAAKLGREQMNFHLKSVGMCAYCLSALTVFSWLCAATYFRFSHTGRVCSGTLSGQLITPGEQPYLHTSGLFLKVITLLLWVLPLAVLTAVIVIVQCVAPRRVDSYRK